MSRRSDRDPPSLSFMEHSKGVAFRPPPPPPPPQPAAVRAVQQFRSSARETLEEFEDQLHELQERLGSTAAIAPRHSPFTRTRTRSNSHSWRSAANARRRFQSVDTSEDEEAEAEQERIRTIETAALDAASLLEERRKQRRQKEQRESLGESVFVSHRRMQSVPGTKAATSRFQSTKSTARPTPLFATRDSPLRKRGWAHVDKPNSSSSSSSARIHPASASPKPSTSAYLAWRRLYDAAHERGINLRDELESAHSHVDTHTHQSQHPQHWPFLTRRPLRISYDEAVRQYQIRSASHHTHIIESEEEENQQQIGERLQATYERLAADLPRDAASLLMERSPRSTATSPQRQHQRPPPLMPHTSPAHRNRLTLDELEEKHGSPQPNVVMQQSPPIVLAHVGEEPPMPRTFSPRPSPHHHIITTRASFTHTPIVTAGATPNSPLFFRALPAFLSDAAVGRSPHSSSDSSLSYSLYARPRTAVNAVPSFPTSSLAFTPPQPYDRVSVRVSSSPVRAVSVTPHTSTSSSSASSHSSPITASPVTASDQTSVSLNSSPLQTHIRTSYSPAAGNGAVADPSPIHADHPLAASQSSLAFETAPAERPLTLNSLSVSYSPNASVARSSPLSSSIYSPLPPSSTNTGSRRFLIVTPIQQQQLAAEERLKHFQLLLPSAKKGQRREE
jgi:hypothetical protein